jgi:hypothetical protein
MKNYEPSKAYRCGWIDGCYGETTGANALAGKPAGAETFSCELHLQLLAKVCLTARNMTLQRKGVQGSATSTATF